MEVLPKHVKQVYHLGLMKHQEAQAMYTEPSHKYNCNDVIIMDFYGCSYGLKTYLVGGET